MNRIQTIQQSIIHPLIHHHPGSLSKNKNKENDPKYLNAIKPYISKQRKNSKRQLNSKAAIPISYQNSRSKSRRNDSYRNVDSSINNKQLGDIYHELISLKAQYHSLKVSYNAIIKEKEKNKTNTNYKQNAAQMSKRTLQFQKLHRQIEKYKNNIHQMQQENQKQKQEFMKSIEIQKYKYRKLQEILQEKQLMIAFLRSQLTNNPISIDQSISQQKFLFQNTAPIISHQIPNTHSYKPSQNHSIISSIPLPQISQIPFKKKIQSDEDSLSFSRDKSKQMESANSLFSNGDHTVLTFTKKDVIILEQSPEPIQTNNEGEEECLTFQNRNQDSKVLNNPAKIQIKKMFNINTDQNCKYQKCTKEGQSLESKKRLSKPKKKPSKHKKEGKQKQKQKQKQKLK